MNVGIKLLPEERERGADGVGRIDDHDIKRFPRFLDELRPVIDDGRHLWVVEGFRGGGDELPAPLDDHLVDLNQGDALDGWVPKDFAGSAAVPPADD